MTNKTVMIGADQTVRMTGTDPIKTVRTAVMAKTTPMHKMTLGTSPMILLNDGTLGVHEMGEEVDRGGVQDTILTTHHLHVVDGIDRGLLLHTIRTRHRRVGEIDRGLQWRTIPTTPRLHDEVIDR